MPGVTADATTLPYQVPEPAGDRRPARGWLAAALLAAGLGLVFLAGCFLIGVLTIVSPSSTGLPQYANPPRLTDHQAILVAVLYLVAGACLIGGAVVIAAAARTLLRLIRSG